MIEELGSGVTGFRVGDRVLLGAITPCGQCHACLSGHPEAARHITDANLRGTLKELAQLDGAFVISDEGVVVAACRYLDTTTSDINLSLGFGSRHFAAASISKVTKAIGVVVSESALVRVFADGALIAEVLPELWLLSRRNVKLHAPFSEEHIRDLAVLVKQSLDQI